MIYQITSDNIDLSESMNSLTKDKFGRVESRVKHFPQDACFARVVLNAAPKEQFTVKVELEINGKKYFSDETDFSLEAALIKTVEELLQMMEKDSIVQKRKHLEEKEKIKEALAE
jgi:ribosome-associated translation inhibitor RaiA